MGEFSILMQAIKADKNKFHLLLEKMNPLIMKYVRLLYKDEKEDVYSELSLALWEAVEKIHKYDNDGEIVSYLKTALRNKYLELYRNSRKKHDNEIAMEDELASYDDYGFTEIQYDDAVTNEDMLHFISRFQGVRKKIFYYILIHNLSDVRIAERLNLSRQYVNRMRRILRDLLYDYFGKCVC